MPCLGRIREGNWNNVGGAVHEKGKMSSDSGYFGRGPFMRGTRRINSPENLKLKRRRRVDCVWDVEYEFCRRSAAVVCNGVS